jgi:hypothetical protein
MKNYLVTIEKNKHEKIMKELDLEDNKLKLELAKLKYESLRLHLKTDPQK